MRNKRYECKNKIYSILVTTTSFLLFDSIITIGSEFKSLKIQQFWPKIVKLGLSKFVIL